MNGRTFQWTRVRWSRDLTVAFRYLARWQGDRYHDLESWTFSLAAERVGVRNNPSVAKARKPSPPERETDLNRKEWGEANTGYVPQEKDLSL